MSSNDPAYLGIDLGGTNIQCGVWQDGKLLARDGTKTKADGGAEAVIGRIVKLSDKVLEAASMKRSDIAGLGIGAPGAIDVSKGVVLRAPNLGWEGYPLEKVLEKETGLRVAVDNDVNAGAWGEYKAGVAQGHDHMVAIFVGTGIGGGLVLDGKLHHGHYGTAGEIGFVAVAPGLPPGQRGLEDFASRTNVVRTIVKLIESGHDSVVTELVEGDYSRVRSKIISQAYKADDPLTVDVVDHAAVLVGTAAANTVTLLSLNAVVLGGGLTEAIGKPWVQKVRKTFDQLVYPDQLRDCKVLASALEDDAGVVGAALLAAAKLEA
ncbi:MAG: ROK family protein [Planctomycetota bacterium]